MEFTRPFLCLTVRNLDGDVAEHVMEITRLPLGSLPIEDIREALTRAISEVEEILTHAARPSVLEFRGSS